MKIHFYLILHGFQTIDIYEIESNNLDKYFIEFRDYINDCEFAPSCSHIKEEKCCIKKALKDSKIREERYQNYIKIYNDLKDREEHKW